MTSTDQESWTTWLCDLEEEDYTLINNQPPDTNGVDGTLASHQDHEISPNPQEIIDYSNSSQKRCFSTGSNSSSLEEERHAKTLKTGTSTSPTSAPLSSPSSSSSSYILSFNPPPPIMASTPKGKLESEKKEARRNNNDNKRKTTTTTGSSAARSPKHAIDHIIAERLRRSKISQQFIALSALIPGLKKIDKATVLGDAIKYVKQLQEQVKVLEEESSKRKSVESVVYVEKFHHSGGDEDVSDTSSNSGDGSSSDVSKTNRSMVPEVEARVSEKNVLIRIHCEKHKGVLMFVLKEIEKLHLTVVNSSTLLFGTSMVDITVTAKVEGETSLSVKELARDLRAGLLQFM